MHKIPGVISALIISLFSSSLALCEPAGTNKSPVTIGGIFCLTGEVASGCNAIREGAEVALDEINRAGGINGRHLRFDIQDSHFNPKEAHTLAKRFSANPEVKGVLISGIVETKSAAAPLERAKIPYLTLWDSAPEIEALGDYSFGIGPWLPATYELAAEFVFNRLNARRVAVIATNAEWSLGVAKGFKDKFQELGGASISYEEINPSDSDFRSLLTRVIRGNPEAIYAPITAHTIPFFKQLKQLGYAGKVITSDNITDQVIAQSDGALEGVMQTMASDPDNPEALHLKRLYKERFAKEPLMMVFHSWGYDGVRLMAHALKEHDLTGTPVRDCLLQIKRFRGATGEITFSEEGSWRSPLKVFEVRDGKLRIRD